MFSDAKHAGVVRARNVAVRRESATGVDNERGGTSGPEVQVRRADSALAAGRKRKGEMSIKRVIIAALFGLVVFGAVYGFAASLTVNSKTLGAGSGTVASCNASAS